MKVGARIELHQNPGSISVQTLDSHIRINTGGQTFDLPKDKVMVLDRDVLHDVEALADGAFLITVATGRDSMSAIKIVASSHPSRTRV